MEETFSTKLVIMFVMTELKDIVKSKMEEKGLSIREFARLVGVSHPTISDILNGEKPSYEVCVKLAPVLDLPLELVLRAADKLPPVSPTTGLITEILYLLEKLPLEEQERFLDLLKFEVQRQASKFPIDKTKKPSPPTSRAQKPARTALKES